MKATDDSEPFVPSAGHEPWIDSTAAALHLGISQNTIRRWVKEGKVPAKRTPGGDLRFRRSELDALIV